MKIFVQNILGAMRRLSFPLTGTRFEINTARFEKSDQLFGWQPCFRRKPILSHTIAADFGGFDHMTRQEFKIVMPRIFVLKNGFTVSEF